jgi:hypothetical protein
MFTRSWAAVRGWDPPPYEWSNVFSNSLTGPYLVVPGDDLEVGGGGLDALHRPLHIPLRGVDLKNGKDVYTVWKDLCVRTCMYLYFICTGFLTVNLVKINKLVGITESLAAEKYVFLIIL